MKIFDNITIFKALLGGYFISRGIGKHPERVIDFYELIFVTSGSLVIYEGNEIFELTAGNSLLLCPGIKHGGVEPYSTDLKFYWFHFSPNNEHGLEILKKLPKTTSIYNSERMIIWLRQLLSDSESWKVDEIQASLLITLMLSELAHPHISGQAGNKQLANKAYDYIKINFEQSISTSSIAESLKCNPDYLGRIFKESYGITLTEYLNIQRINYAKKLLLEANMNIDEISAVSGFNDIAYFRRKFRKYLGLAPSDYRKQYSKIYINTH